MFEKIMRWLEDNTPVLCTMCLILKPEKDMTFALMTNGSSVRLCKQCHSALFGEYDDEFNKKG